MTRLDLLQIDLTDECPLFCSHCSNSSGPKLKSALRPGEAREAILDAAYLGCRDIIFSGGEPLRYNELSGLLALCRKLRLNATIFTTGIRDIKTRLPLSSKNWKKLMALGLDTAVFSSYSSPTNRGFHDQVVRLRPTGTQDAFEVNELGIVRAQEAGIAVELQFIPSNETCSDLPAISVWAAGLGVSRLHLQYPTNQGRNQDTASLIVTRRSEALLRADALALCNESPVRLHISRMWRSRWGIASDTAQLKQVIVRSDGIAVLCNACKYLVEPLSQKNICRQPLRQIWGDEKWRDAPCECSKRGNQQVRQVTTSSRSSSLHFVRADGLLTPGAE
jgi:MoaA/NifB/PqqE/SkfB family radical SAM enzyme